MPKKTHSVTGNCMNKKGKVLCCPFIAANRKSTTACLRGASLFLIFNCCDYTDNIISA